MTDIIKTFQERYSQLHPLVFARSVERANSPGELFDILEEIPPTMPIVWDEESRRWISTEDILQSRSHGIPDD